MCNAGNNEADYQSFPAFQPPIITDFRVGVEGVRRDGDGEGKWGKEKKNEKKKERAPSLPLQALEEASTQPYPELCKTQQNSLSGQERLPAPAAGLSCIAN